jgi:hypothetical protein
LDYSKASSSAVREKHCPTYPNATRTKTPVLKPNRPKTFYFPISDFQFASRFRFQLVQSTLLHLKMVLEAWNKVLKSDFMKEITIHIKNNDKYVAAMVKALSFQTAPNLKARSASVKGATMDANGQFTLHMADEQIGRAHV